MGVNLWHFSLEVECPSMRSPVASNSHFLFLWGSFPAGVLQRVVVSVAVENEKGENHINKS